MRNYGLDIDREQSEQDGTVKIPLGIQGKHKGKHYAIINSQDYQELSKKRWRYDGRYAISKDPMTKKKIYMHRLIAKTPQGLDTDHINGNKLDNRRENIRVCSRSLNECNQGKQANNSSGYKGVFFFKRDKTWQAQITINGKKNHLGYFKHKLAAANAYNKAALQLHGEYAKLNAI